MSKSNNKIIHYCWFGGAPLSDLTKKCIESWKKYLPDFEIKEWNEQNFDVNQCEFIKQAYEQKKWAFVADYTRFKVLEEFGGLYLDTDMEITKNVSKYLQHDLFLGVEDSKMINAAVVWAKEKENKHIKNIVNIYEEMEEFNPTGDLYEMSVPRVLTKYFNDYNFKQEECEKLQVLDDKQVYIYPMEYFYPLSYDHQHNNFTKNSCMIHHFDATWISKMEKFKTNLKRKNMKWVVHIIDFFINSKNRIYSFLNNKDISVFLMTFLILFFTTLAFTGVQEKLSILTLVFGLIFSIVWTIICKQVRTIELNELLDINLLENKENNNRKRHINDEKKVEILRFENKIFLIQLLVTVLFLLVPNMYSVYFANMSYTVFNIAFLILLTMLYTGIKKDFKYRILDLIILSLALAIISTFSLNGLIVSTIMFAITLFLLFKEKVAKKRIIAFGGSLVVFCICTLLARNIIYHGVSFDANQLTISNFKNFEIINISDKIPDNYTKFEFGRNIYNNITQKCYNNIILKSVLNNSVTLYVGLLFTAILTVLSKNKKYLLLIIPILLNSIFKLDGIVHTYTNWVFLMFISLILSKQIFRHLYKNEKIKMF